MQVLNAFWRRSAFCLSVARLPLLWLVYCACAGEVYVQVHVQVQVQVQVHVQVHVQLSVAPFKFLCDYFFCTYLDLSIARFFESFTSLVEGFFF